MKRCVLMFALTLIVGWVPSQPAEAGGTRYHCDFYFEGRMRVVVYAGTDLSWLSGPGFYVACWPL